MPASSLPEIHSSVSTGQLSRWRRWVAFSGPALLVSVGYMDPGNWATDLEGGARFGYQLLWVLVLANAMAILLQTLSARLGIISQRDLAQACREAYPKPVSVALWVLCEVAIAACDLAEVLGAAIGLNLLFHIPLLAGVLLTSFDTLLMLWLTRLGIRAMESFVLALIATIALCFVTELWWASPALGPIAGGLIPHLNNESLYVAIGILGATVMPHNLYLHSALVQTRSIGRSEKEKRTACRYNFLDCMLALNGALFVNGAILVLSATVFFGHGVIVTEIQQAHQLLTPLLGAAFASGLFAVALLCAGQSSTLTGTMAGQIVMEGFLNFRMRPALRRLVTRVIAIIPASIVVYAFGDEGSYKLLILSQVILNLQLPFAVIPLIRFTSDRERMGNFANPRWVKTLAWTAAGVILGLDGWLTFITIGDWIRESGWWRPWLEAGLVLILTGLFALLIWMILEPWLPARLRRPVKAPFDKAGLRRAAELPGAIAVHLPAPEYRIILVPLDHSIRDRIAITHAAALARNYGAKLYLLHVEEDVTSQIYGAMASTAEVTAGQEYLDALTGSLQLRGVEVEKVVRFSPSPKAEIVRYANELKPDLIVMGAPGHKGLKDIIFGTTINALRHKVHIPLLIVRDPDW
jgi:manganese transport protein